MGVGILIEGCVNVKLHNNSFHNIDQPIVIKGSREVTATGNVATYDDDLNASPEIASRNTPHHTEYTAMPVLYGSLGIYFLSGLLNV